MLGTSGGISDANYGDDYHVANEITWLVNEAVAKGSVSNQDNRSVFQILKNFALGRYLWEWIHSFNGKEYRRHAFAKLCEQYIGPGETRKQLPLARKHISKIHYKLEHTFTFKS
jgi:hypothetical protein